jgi:hypothetical protein
MNKGVYKNDNIERGQMVVLATNYINPKFNYDLRFLVFLYFNFNI